MVKTVSVETMRRSDAWTIEHKIPSAELMRRAGEAIYRAVDWKSPVGIVCGKGNNAGDGFVVAGYLSDAGVSVELILISEAFSADGKYYYDVCREKGIKSRMYCEGMELSGYGTLLDCIFGTGFSGEPNGLYRNAIEAINASGAFVVSADINSGLNGDTGLGTVYVRSDLTVSIGEFKHGHFLGLAGMAMKEKINIDIGIEIKEFLDVVDENGNPTGKVVEREEAHANGIPHRTSHVWIVRKKNGRVQILLQKRSETKDADPGCYDISSAGHIPAGSSYEESAIRELEEELGVRTEPSRLVYCGHRIIVWDKEFHGRPYHDRQYAKIYLLWLDMEEGEFILQPEEVDSVIWMDFDRCVRNVADNLINHCIFMEELEMVRKTLEKKLDL